MAEVFLNQSARWLLVVHALAGMALLGSTTHLLLAVASVLRGRHSALRMIRVQSAVVLVLTGVTLALGLLLYPHFRVHVRGVGLDRDQPWASNLFDIKENFALLVLPLAAVMAASRSRMKPGSSVAPLFAVCALGSWLLVSFASVSGLVVTSVRGI